MHCPNCGQALKASNRYCTKCGKANSHFEPESDQTQSLHNDETYRYEATINDGFQYKKQQSAFDAKDYSGEYDNYGKLPIQSDYTQVPGKFNWGAFSLTIPWGIGNRCYICLLALIPGINLIISILAGFMGNEWAINNNNYRDMEEFSKIQSTWNRAGFVFFLIAIIPVAFFIFTGVMTLMTAPVLMSDFI